MQLSSRIFAVVLLSFFLVACTNRTGGATTEKESHETIGKAYTSGSMDGNELDESDTDKTVIPDTVSEVSEKSLEYETTPANSSPRPIEGNIMPYSMMAFNRWTTDDAEFEDGIWSKTYSVCFVPVYQIAVWREMSFQSEKTYLALDRGYYPIASDGENWIYMSDLNGSGGWMYVVFNGIWDYDVLIDDYLYRDMMSSFVFDHDGMDIENPIKAITVDESSDTCNNELRVYSCDDEVAFWEKCREYDISEDDMRILEKYAEERATVTGTLYNMCYRVYWYRIPGEAVSSRFMYDEINDRMVVMVWYTPGETHEFIQPSISVLDNDMSYIFSYDPV